MLIWLLIQTEPVQNWLVQKVTTRLSKDLNTEIKIKHVSFSLFNRANIEGILVKDHKKDTLLYADQLKVRLTDWFFIKNELTLKYVGLEDAYINMYREDSIWNYQFIVDYFSPSKPSQSKSNLKFNLKRVDFKNVRFVQNDEWIGSKMFVQLDNLQLDADILDLERKTIKINEINLEKPVFGMYDFDGKRPPRKKIKQSRNDTTMYFNEGDLNVSVGKITIKNGVFINEIETGLPPTSHFDGEHFKFEKINGTINDFRFLKDTLKAKIDLSTKERSGFEVKKLAANFKLTPEIMEFSKLLIETPRSKLEDYYAMKFTDFNLDFKDYIHSVTMEARLKNSTVSSDDIAYFAPELKPLKREITIWGTGKGTVDDLSITNLFVRSGNNTSVSGNLSMKGLPDLETTVFNFKSGNLRTTYRDAVSFAPEIAKIDVPSISSLGNIQFTGDFNGTLRNFSTKGTFSTNLGAFSGNVNMKLPAKGIPAYEGKIMTKKFDVGKFLVLPDLGNVIFDGEIKGVGLDLNTLKTKVTGNIQQLTYNNYDYKNIVVEGLFQRRQYEGTLKIDDPNLNFFTSLKMDFREEQPKFNVLGDLVTSNFQNLNFTKNKLQITGLFDLNFRGRNIDEFLGSAKMYNANIVQNDNRVKIDSLVLNSGIEDGKRTLSLASNELDAKVEGEYNILDLPNTFQTFLHKYYPTYIGEPKKSIADQQFTFELNTRNIDGYTQLLDEKLKGFNYSTISGRINTTDTIFTIYSDVPEFTYDKYTFSNITIEGKGDLTTLKLDGQVGNILIGDSTSFPNTKINIVSENDLSEISIKTKATNTLNELNLNADVLSFEDGVKIKFKSSDFVINEKRWELEKEGEIVIRENFVSAENVKFSQGEQVITVKTTHDPDFDKSNLLVVLRNLHIGDFTPFLTTDPRMEGLASGEIEMKDFFGRFTIDANLTAQQFRVDNDSIGMVYIIGQYNNAKGIIDWNINSPNEAYDFVLDGSFDLKDSLGLPLKTKWKFKKSKIGFINRFLSSVFTDVEGFASGDLEINGDITSPELLGKLKLSEGSLLVNFTQVRYYIDSASFNFRPGVLDFGTFTIKDKFGNTGTASGKIYQNRMENIRYDFTVNSPRLLVIDTRPKDNDQFYGNAICKALLTLNGPQENLKMGIVAEPVDTSNIFLPTSDSKVSGQADYIVFKQHGVEMKPPTSAGATNIIVDLDLTANPLVNIDVILDELTGDIIKAVGNGRLRIHAGTIDPLTINGRFDVLKGSYDFNFQSLIKKPFILKEDGNSFIEWNGDPYNARLQVQAVYIAENVRLGDLVSNQNFGGVTQSYQGDVYVIANITGILLKPVIKFKIEFPQNSQVSNDENLRQLFVKMEQDENEMLKQVTYLLVFNNFAPYGQGSNFGNLGIALTFNTISELASKMINNVLSNILYQITGDRSWQVDISTSLYNSSSLFAGGNVTATNAIDRTKVNVKVGKSLFNNKVIVTFGNDFDFGVQKSTTSQQLGNWQWLPDVTIEIILSKNRKLRANVFYRNSFDINSNAVGLRNKQGVSISYRRDFGIKNYKLPELKK